MLKRLSNYLDFDTASSKEAKGSSSKENKLTQSFDFISLIKSWPKIAGEKLSEHTIPLKNQNGTLLILSNHSAFANELSYMEIPLKNKIFATFPSLQQSIQKIKFIVDTTHFNQQFLNFAAPLEKIKKKNETLLHPYSPEFRRLKKEAENLFSDIQEIEIKEQMISLYIQSMNAKSS